MADRDATQANGDALAAITDVAEGIAWQADHCERAGAPCTARIVRAELAILKTDTATGRRLANWHGKVLEDALPLRVAGGLHHLHLSGEDKRLQPVYAGLVTDQDSVDAIVTASAEQFDNLLLPWLDSPPQTNEAGRSANIMAALLWLSGKLGPRFELIEIGASAGINTMMGRFHFNLGGVTVGPSLSSMRIEPEWRGAPPPRAEVEITDIAGCDTAPVDLTDPAQALRLKSYVWSDAIPRLARLDTAIAMAKRVAPELARMDAAQFVADRLARPQEEGVTRVLFHTVVWQYLPPATRDEITGMMEEAGASATPERPLAWIQVEINRATFSHDTSVRYWPGGENETQLAKAHPHGTWVEWLAPDT